LSDAPKSEFSRVSFIAPSTDPQSPSPLVELDIVPAGVSQMELGSYTQVEYIIALLKLIQTCGATLVYQWKRAAKN